MSERKSGQIVNIASAAHLCPGINLGDYSASKAALYNFHTSLRLGNFFYSFPFQNFLFMLCNLNFLNKNVI